MSLLRHYLFFFHINDFKVIYINRMIDTCLSQNYLTKEKKTHQAFITTFVSFNPSSYRSHISTIAKKLRDFL